VLLVEAVQILPLLRIPRQVVAPEEAFKDFRKTEPPEALVAVLAVTHRTQLAVAETPVDIPLQKEIRAEMVNLMAPVLAAAVLINQDNQCSLRPIQMVRLEETASSGSTEPITLVVEVVVETAALTQLVKVVEAQEAQVTQLLRLVKQIPAAGAVALALKTKVAQALVVVLAWLLSDTHTPKYGHIDYRCRFCG
jgi:hypothetical protein